MLKVYNVDLKSLFVGEGSIQSAYVGNTQVFNAIPSYNIILTYEIPEGAGGSVSGGGTFKEGEIITVIATPQEGSRFVGWYANGLVVSKNESYTFVVTEDVELVAVFAKASRLPNGYTEVEYLDFGGKTYISGALLNSWEQYKTEIVMSLLPTTEAGKCILGQQGLIRSSSTMTYGFNHCLFYDGTNMNLKSKYAAYNGATNSATGVNVVAQSGKMSILVDAANNLFKVNNNSTSFTLYSGVYSAQSVSIGGYSYALKNSVSASIQTTKGGVGNTAFRLYSIMTYAKDGTPQKNLVPCIQTLDNTPGLYDLVNAKFFGEGTHTVTEGVITTGPEV